MELVVEIVRAGSSSVNGLPSGSDDRKRRAALAALERVTPGMKLGLGTGSTANEFVTALGARVQAGLSVLCVPTSERTADLARSFAIPLTTLDETPALDLTVDGADEFDRSLRLVKGGGGALLREKIVATASTRMIVIADDSKLVDTIGAFPLPIEVVPFGVAATERAIAALAAKLALTGPLKLRQTSAGDAYRTDSNHFIIDASFGRIPDPEALAVGLDEIAGVMGHGLFIGIASEVIVASRDDTVTFGRR